MGVITNLLDFFNFKTFSFAPNTLLGVSEIPNILGFCIIAINSNTLKR